MAKNSNSMKPAYVREAIELFVECVKTCFTRRETIPPGYLIQEAMGRLLIEFMKTKAVKNTYPKATIEDMVIKHFDIRAAITQNPDIFPRVPYIVNGTFLGEFYILDKKNLIPQLETLWEYKRDEAGNAPLKQSA